MCVVNDCKVERLVRFPPPVLRKSGCGTSHVLLGYEGTPLASIRGRGPDVISSQLGGVHQRSLIIDEIDRVDVMSDLLADIRLVAARPTDSHRVLEPLLRGSKKRK